MRLFTAHNAVYINIAQSVNCDGFYVGKGVFHQRVHVQNAFNPLHCRKAGLGYGTFRQKYGTTVFIRKYRRFKRAYFLRDFYYFVFIEAYQRTKYRKRRNRVGACQAFQRLTGNLS